MKRTLSIFLSITVLLSLLLMPTTVSAQGDTIDTKTATAINIGDTDYQETIQTTSNEDEYKTYKITADTAGVYHFYTSNGNSTYATGSLYKPEDLLRNNYIKQSYYDNRTLKDRCSIYFYLKKGETVYFEICAITYLKDEAEYHYDFKVKKESTLVAKNGIIYEPKISSSGSDNDSYNAFDCYLSKKQSVTFESKINNLPVTSISSYALYNCKYITGANIPSSYNTIYKNAFKNCTNLKTVNLSEGMKILEFGAFDYTNIESIYLPSTITDATYLYSMSSLKNITVASNSPTYTAKKGVLFSKDMKKLVVFPTRNCTDYTVPNGVTTICTSAFYQSNIQSITFPKSLKNIGYNAFSYSAALTNINFNEGLTSLDTFSFSYCRNLCWVKLPSTLQEIKTYAFSGCNLLSVEIPESVVTISNYAFYNNENLESVVIKNKDANLSGNSVFYQCNSPDIYAPSNSTAQTYANSKGYNFISTDLPEGTECTDHKYVLDNCVKQPDCMNYGIFSTKCAICSKAGSNKKVHSLNHKFIDRTCRFCGIITRNYITAEFNKTYSTSFILNTSEYTSNGTYITFIAPADGRYYLNISNLNSKCYLMVNTIQSNFISQEFNEKIIDKNYKESFILNKNDQLRIKFDQIEDYTYYEPIKYDFKFTCDHNYKNTVVKPTYTSNGYTLHKCTTCNHSYKDKTTKKLTLPTPSGVTVKSQKKAFTVSYKKVAKAKGYQIQYSTSSKFKSAKTVKLTKNTTVKKTISKLSSKKKYFIRVRSYVVQNKKTAYSNWSKTKNIKTK